MPPVRLSAARRRYGFDAGAADDFDHGVRARAAGQDGPSQRRKARRPRRGDGDDRRCRARPRHPEGRRGCRRSRDDAAAREMLVGRYRVPQPRNALAQAVRDHASAAMDVSDGLAGDLAKLCAASGVSAVDRCAEHSAVGGGCERCWRAAPSASRRSFPAATITRSCARSRRISFEAFAQSRRQAGVAVTSIGTIIAGASAPMFLDAAGQGNGAAAPVLQPFLAFQPKARVADANTCRNRPFYGPPRRCAREVILAWSRRFKAALRAGQAFFFMRPPRPR